MRADDGTIPYCNIIKTSILPISGLVVCRELRSHQATRETSILFLTGIGDAAASALTTEATADGFLTKPVSLVDLFEAVRAATIRRQRSGDRGGALYGPTPPG
jgi:DNA-binding response OmpR family regulator